MKLRSNILSGVHLASLIGLLSILSNPSIADSWRVKFVAFFAFVWAVSVALLIASFVLDLIHTEGNRKKSLGIALLLTATTIYLIATLIGAIVLLGVKAN